LKYCNVENREFDNLAKFFFDWKKVNIKEIGKENILSGENFIFKFFNDFLSGGNKDYSVKYIGGTYQQLFDISSKNEIVDFIEEEICVVSKNVFAHGISGNRDQYYNLNLNAHDNLY
jgi:hypothetical protein